MGITFPEVFFYFHVENCLLALFYILTGHILESQGMCAV